ncbi:MAG TPA: serine/threonine-protein kinase [Gemmataceae bacterium]|nr:serine/threonine-protein kinase [Gemmataceae bacterium]
MNDESQPSDDTLLPLLVAFDEGLAVGREPQLAVPSELADDFGAAQSVLRLLNQAWPRTGPADTTVDESAPESDAPAAPPVEPIRLGRFQVLRELGQGGFGVVYLAYDPTLARRVALKAPRSDRWRTPEFRRRFLQEGRAAALLDHPNIVRVLEAESTESSGYIASAYCEGPSLAVWLRERKGPLPCRLAAALTADLAAGVHHAHSRGVVHRDLKPANVLLEIGSEKDASGLPRTITPKICDFGLAKLLETEQTDTRSGAVLGTPQYMAPEQAEGRTRDIGPAADVYALGVLLYEMLTGRPPFVGEPGLDLLKRVTTAAPERPRRRRKDVPRDLETIVLTCLEKEPGRRYASAAALETDLRRWLDGKAPLGRPEPVHRRIGRWVRRHPVWTAAAALLVAVAVAGAIAAPYLDPDRPVKEAQTKLQHNQRVALIGEKGGPDWSRFRTGRQFGTTDVTPDAVFHLRASGGMAMLELLPDPGVDSYRFRVQLRHDAGESISRVGIYIGAHECATSRGGVHSFVELIFNDIVLQTAAFQQQLKNQPALDNIPLPPGNPVPFNPVQLQPHFWSDPKYGADWDCPCRGAASNLVEPAGPYSDVWRDLTIEVTPKGVRAFWKDGQPIGGLLTTADLENAAADQLAARPRRPADGPGGQEPNAAFVPRGGIGLLVRNGTGSFRNVAVEPLTGGTSLAATGPARSQFP